MTSTPPQPFPRRAELRRSRAATASRRAARRTVRRSVDLLTGWAPRRASSGVTGGAHLSVLSVLVVAGIAVTNTMPAFAVTPPAGTMTGGIDSDTSPAQTFVAAAAIASTATRDAFTAEAKAPEPSAAPIWTTAALSNERESESALTITSEWVSPVSGRISSRYGPRPDRPVPGVGAYHYGTDIAASCGTPIVAAAAGTVVAASYVGTYGNWILIDHGHGVRTGYAHNQDFLIEEGASVEAGDLIALLGSTGASSGCHLHFETQLHDERLDPEKFMSALGVFLG